MITLYVGVLLVWKGVRASSGLGECNSPPPTYYQKNNKNNNNKVTIVKGNKNN